MNPGVWTSEKFNESYYAKLLGHRYLNHDCVVVPISKVPSIPLNEFFIKPDGDSKEFAGQTMTATEFKQWYDQMISIGYLSNNDFDVAVSPIKQFGDEYRLVVVNGKIATGSLYRRYRQVYPRAEYPSELQDVVDILEKSFRPADVYVVDITDTENGWKVVEYNTFNSAGFYKCNVPNIIDSINKFIESK